MKILDANCWFLRTFIFIAFVVALTSTLSAQNTVRIEDGSGASCDTAIAIPVLLTHTIPVQRFSFKIIFNDSVLIATRVESTARTSDFEFSGVIEMGSNWLRFKGVAHEGEPIESGDGPIANIVFNVNCAANLGDSTAISFVAESCSVLDTSGAQLPGLQFENGLFVVVETEVSEEPRVTKPSLQLHLFNYPNPFIRSTTISYCLPHPGSHKPVSLDVFDNTGRRLASCPVNSKNGRGSFEWYGIDNNGAQLSSGVYIYRLNCMDEDGSAVSISKRMILLR